MVLGVPLPDFVKGRLLPGRTKTTQERVDPVPIPGQVSDAVDTALRTLNEAPGQRYFVSAEDAGIVAAYLAAIHLENSKKRKQPLSQIGDKKDDD